SNRSFSRASSSSTAVRRSSSVPVGMRAHLLSSRCAYYTIGRRRARRRLSVRNAAFVQPFVDGGEGFLEGAFQDRQMVGLAVMGGDGSRLPLRRAVADVLQAAVYQRQHVVQRIRAEQVVSVAAGQIDRGGMSHDPAPPTVVVRNRRIVRPGAT